MVFEENAFLDPNRKTSYSSTTLSNFSLVTSYTLFEALTFWNKLEFLKNSTNKELLKEIQEKVQSPQMQALALYRLYQLDI